MIRLDDIEAKARAVNCPETWDSGDFACGIERTDADYIDAIKPETVLALVRIARCAKAFVDAPATKEQDPFNNLEEALKGVE